MTSEVFAGAVAEVPVEVEREPSPPTLLPAAERRKVMAYFTVMALTIGIAAPYSGLFDIPISFLLKNKLHLGAPEVSAFRLWAAMPLYFSFAFGLIRDTWNPFGMRDRGYFVLFGAVGASLYTAFAFAPVAYIGSYAGLVAAMISVTIAFLFVWGAWNGFSAALGQQQVMSGLVSAVFGIMAVLPISIAFLVGGAFSQRLEAVSVGGAIRAVFLTGAGMMALIALLGLWRPAVVFDNIRPEPALSGRFLADLKRLALHWPIYPALLIWLMWNFAPGLQTALQYHLSNNLHGTDADWGNFNAIFWASFVPTFVAYGVLCQKVPLNKLLFWGTIIGIPQLIPILLIHSASEALFIAVAMGLMGGVASGAYFDLLIRSCPPGLQGTVMMLSVSMFWISVRLSDVLGAFLYQHFGGFLACIAAITIVYALILPVLLIVPRRLTATADGEAPAG